MGTTYKILGQVQSLNAASLQVISGFPDPNFERFTADTTATNPGTLSIWNQYNAHDSHTSTHYSTGAGVGANASGRTNYVRFSGHQHPRDQYWELQPATRVFLDSSKTYTLSLWYKYWNDNNSYWYGGHHGGHYLYYNLNNARGGNQIADSHHGHPGVTDTQGQSYWDNWVQHYTTFQGTNNYFNLNARLHNGSGNGTSFWQYMAIDNVYLTEGAIPKALLPAKALDGSTGNPNALYTAPFNVRSEGWQNTANESPTVRKMTGSWQTLYQVPDLNDASAVISTITITNTGSSTTTYRIAIQKNGESLTNKHLLAFDVPIAPSGLETLTLGLTIGRQDKILVQADSDKIQFSAFGSENTQ